MTNKYIIRNCNCYCEKLLSHDFSTDKSEVADRNVCIGSISNNDYHCQDCTDCVLKQIVELCKYYKKHSDCGRECPSFGGFLNKLLNKLDIEEVK